MAEMNLLILISHQYLLLQEVTHSLQPWFQIFYLYHLLQILFYLPQVYSSNLNSPLHYHHHSSNFYFQQEKELVSFLIFSLIALQAHLSSFLHLLSLQQESLQQVGLSSFVMRLDPQLFYDRHYLSLRFEISTSQQITHHRCYMNLLRFGVSLQVQQTLSSKDCLITFSNRCRLCPLDLGYQLPQLQSSILS